MAWWEGVEETRILIAPGRSAFYLFFMFLISPFLTVLTYFILILEILTQLDFSCSITDHGVKENGTGCLLSLRHPKSGNSRNWRENDSYLNTLFG